MSGIPFDGGRYDPRILKFFSELETVPAESSQLDSENSREKFIENLRRILALRDAIEKRSGEWCEKDLRNLDEDVNEVLSRNAHLTGIRVA